MGYNTTSYSMICDTVTDRNNLNATFPSLVEGTLAFTIEDNKTHKKTSSVWVQYQPHAAYEVIGSDY